MKAVRWREMADEELHQKARELSEELFNLRFQLSMGVAKNPARVRQARRDLARAQTVLRERQLRAAAARTPRAGTASR
jgi:large subunit ribosomal protein L29